MDTVDIDWVYKEYQGQDLTGKTLFLWRTGGAGDLIAMLVAIQEAKRRYPTCKIVLCCESKYMNLFYQNPHVDEVRPYPVKLNWLEPKNSDYHLCFEALVEDNEDAKHMHFFDLFFNKFGYRGIPSENKIPTLSCDAKAAMEMQHVFEQAKIGPDDFTIGIQLIVAAPKRRYPPSYLAAMAKTLVENHRAKIVWIGSPSQVTQIQSIGIDRYGLQRFSLNLPGAKGFTTWQHTVAAIGMCDIVLASDSSTNHIAGSNKVIVADSKPLEAWPFPYRFGYDWKGGATHTPQVGIFGPIFSHQRMKYYRQAFGIDADVMCAGCNQHGYDPCWRAGGSGISPCFWTITMAYVHEVLMSAAIECNKRRPNPKDIRNPSAYLTAAERLEELIKEEPMQFLPAPNYMDSVLRQEI